MLKKKFFQMVSSLKYNKLTMILKQAEMLRHEQFGRLLPAEALARPGIKSPSNGIRFRLGKIQGVCPLGEVLPEQWVNVLVDAALPTAMRMGEIDAYASNIKSACALRHRMPLNLGHGETVVRINALSTVPKR